jgi:hypothetical protein
VGARLLTTDARLARGVDVAELVSRPPRSR